MNTAEIDAKLAQFATMPEFKNVGASIARYTDENISTGPFPLDRARTIEALANYYADNLELAVPEGVTAGVARLFARLASEA